MKSILILILLTTVAFADSGSGSNAGSAAGVGSSSGSGSDAGSGAANAGSNTPPAADYPMPAGVKPTQVCLDEMDKDPAFADYILRRTEQKLNEKLDRDRVQKDLCVVYDHTQAAEHVAKNERHVIIAYVAMWLVAAGFVLYLWRKQQALKHELATLRNDLDAATKDGK